MGSHLVERLLGRQDLEFIVVVDNLWTGKIDNLINDDRIRFEEADAETFHTTEKFDEIFHLASPASPRWYQQEPIRTIQANVNGAINLLDKLRFGGGFGFTSTSEVYGEPAISPQPENYRGAVDCTGPRACYDEGKRCTEAMLFELHGSTGVQIRVARLFNVCGPRMQVDDGRAVPNFLVQALTGKSLTIYGDGLQSRSWGYVDDIVDALARYFWLDDHDYIGPLNIGNDTEIPVIDVVHTIGRIVPGITVKYEDALPQDPTHRRPDLSLARRILPGWEARIGLEEGLERTLDWFREACEWTETPEPAHR